MLKDGPSATTRRFLFGALLAILLFGSAHAQSLVAIAPADTVVAIRYGEGGSHYPAFMQDLKALHSDAHKSGLHDALVAQQAQTDDQDVAFYLAWLLDALDGNKRPLAVLTDECPQLSALDMAFPVPTEALFTLSMSPYAITPAAMVLMRFAADDVSAAAALQDAFIECVGEDLRLDQDGVPLSVVGDGSDMPIALARDGDLFMLGSQVDTLRGAIRRASGSSEASLASTPLGSSPAWTGSGLSAALSFEALAELTEGLGGMAGPDAAGAVQRLTSALRTVPYAAMRIEARPEGIVSESWVRVDPEGGDAALAALLRCDGCRVRPSVLVPADAIGTSALPLRLRAWTDYLIGFGESLASSMGEDVDIRSEIRDATGIDIEKDVLSWMGDRIDVVALPPVRTNLLGFAGQPASVMLIPVSSPEAAQAALQRLAEAAWPLVLELEDSMTRDLGIGLDQALATRTTMVRGIEVTRLQYGPTTDIAVAYLGNHLVVADPAAAIDRLIDTYQGGPTVFDNAAFSSILRQSPDDVMAFAIADEAAMLRLYQPLVAAMAQPMAFGLSAALSESELSPVGFTTLVEVSELPARALAVLADHLGVSRAWSMTTTDGAYSYSLTPLR